MFRRGPKRLVRLSLFDLSVCSTRTAIGCSHTNNNPNKPHCFRQAFSHKHQNTYYHRKHSSHILHACAVLLISRRDVLIQSSETCMNEKRENETNY
jgi:hypothetical protein